MSKSVKRVTAAIQRLYPRELADSSWDNTGLLLDSSEPSDDQKPKILLAIDLTQKVCSEAIDNKCNIVVAYHPFIFKGLKSITSKDPQQASLLRLVKQGISVYSPHTAIDAAKGGVNDWLADGVTDNGKNEQVRDFVTKVEHPELEAGMGRFVELKEPLSLQNLVEKLKKYLGLDTVQVVCADTHKTELVKTVAMCAGSGGSVLRGTTADVIFTGELGHHEMLYLRETGKSAIVCGHSNTERGFLTTFKQQLEKELDLSTGSSDIIVSTVDKDPIEYW